MKHLTKVLCVAGFVFGLLLARALEPQDAEAQIIPGGSCSPTKACSSLSLTSASSVTGVNYVATIADGGTAFSCSSTTGSCVFNSTTSQATATSSVPAFDFKPAFLAADDLVARFRQGDGGTAWTVDTEGDVLVKGGINSTGTTPLTITGGTAVISFARSTNDLLLKFDSSTYARWNYASGIVDLMFGVAVPAGRKFTSSAASGANGFELDTNGARLDFGAGASDYASSDGTTVTFAGPIQSAATQTRGTTALTTGGATVTVIAGAVCVCSEVTDATKTVGCAVASTTLTITGNGSDTISYICL